MVSYTIVNKGKREVREDDDCFAKAREVDGNDYVLYHCARGIAIEIEDWYLSEVSKFLEFKINKKTGSTIYFKVNNPGNVNKQLAVLTALRYLDNNEEGEYHHVYRILEKAFEWRNEKADFITILFAAHWFYRRFEAGAHFITNASNYPWASYQNYLPDSIKSIKNKDNPISVHSFFWK